ncbi:uncharacterized protein SCODWIG_00440 [Saccharomycodes ludwigii]|uniref:RRM domain-containing protein n=1 Tax=Saccharomycodes ludwigii TaxID=36035 RepID=A0A376B244_9ASCO|nr:uncharacterized protein SCODWIG_00440 [Saccharomycodes ludwigii]
MFSPSPSPIGRYLDSYNVRRSSSVHSFDSYTEYQINTNTSGSNSSSTNNNNNNSGNTTIIQNTMNNNTLRRNSSNNIQGKKTPLQRLWDNNNNNNNNNTSFPLSPGNIINNNNNRSSSGTLSHVQDFPALKHENSFSSISSSSNTGYGYSAENILAIDNNTNENKDHYYNGLNIKEKYFDNNVGVDTSIATYNGKNKYVDNNQHCYYYPGEGNSSTISNTIDDDGNGHRDYNVNTIASNDIPNNTVDINNKKITNEIYGPGPEGNLDCVYNATNYPYNFPLTTSSSNPDDASEPVASVNLDPSPAFATAKKMFNASPVPNSNSNAYSNFNSDFNSNFNSNSNSNFNSNSNSNSNSNFNSTSNLNSNSNSNSNLDPNYTSASFFLPKQLLAQQQIELQVAPKKKVYNQHLTQAFSSSPSITPTSDFLPQVISQNQIIVQRHLHNPSQQQSQNPQQFLQMQQMLQQQQQQQQQQQKDTFSSSQSYQMLPHQQQLQQLLLQQPQEPIPPTSSSMNDLIEPISRTVYLGNTPLDLTYSQLLDHVRSGVIEDVKILPEKSCAFISFTDENSALLFHSDAILKKLNIGGNNIKVGWGKATPLDSIVAASVNNEGATRNVYIGNLNTDNKSRGIIGEGETNANNDKTNGEEERTPIHKDMENEDGEETNSLKGKGKEELVITEEKLRHDLKHYGTIENIKIVAEKGIAFVHFTSIFSAIKVVTTLPFTNTYYSNKKVAYGKDRCSFITKTQQHNAAMFLGIPHGMEHLISKSNPQFISNTLAQQSAAAAAIATTAGGANNLGNRTIYLGNLPKDVRIDEICNVVRGGMLQKIKLLEDRHVSFVTFIDPTAAAQFYALSQLHGLTIHSRKCKVGWGKHSGPLSNALALAVGQGASRNIYLGNITFDSDVYNGEPFFSEANLRKFFSQYGSVEQINFLVEKNCCFINFTDINNAILAIDKIKDNSHFKSLKINFGKDRCGNMPRQNV